MVRTVTHTAKSIANRLAVATAPAQPELPKITTQTHHTNQKIDITMFYLSVSLEQYH